MSEAPKFCTQEFVKVPRNHLPRITLVGITVDLHEKYMYMCMYNDTCTSIRKCTGM